MVSQSLPSPPADDSKPSPSTGGRKNMMTHGSKSVKPTNRASKRASASAAQVHHHDHITHGSGMDARHKRVWKACERCRMKKTKCDGEFPCKRCKDDGLVCTAGVRKKMEYKQLPRGYAEVLENTQVALIATVHKLYAMVRNHQEWDLGEPEMNDRGQPVIHNIAQRLGCIRPNSDIDLPVHSVFPEDEAGMTELARQLEEQQHQEKDRKVGEQDSPVFNRADRASSSELDQSDFEPDHRRTAFGGHNAGANPMTLSPQSFAGSTDFDFTSAPAAPAELSREAMFAQSPQGGPFQNWVGTMPRKTEDMAAMQFLHQAGMLTTVDLMSPGYGDTEFGTIKPNVLSCPNPNVMMGMGDPMIYTGYDGDAMRVL